MTPRTRSYHGRDTEQVPRGNLLVGACRLVLELATSGAVLLNGSAIAQAQSLIANALPPGSPAYLKETWRSALHAPMPFGDQSCVASAEQSWPSTMVVSTPLAASSSRLYRRRSLLRER